MLQTKYKTNSLMRCKNLGFAIPLGSILVLLLFVSLSFALPWQNQDSAYAVDNTDASITPLADSPSASLSIANHTLSSAGEAGDVVSMSSNVSINATLINSYNLQIASGVSTTESNNPTYLEGPTTIIPIDNTSNPNGISSVEGLVDNTWGYSWNNGSYKGISTSNVSIESANVGNTNNGTVSFTKPLTFVAKFNKDANAGHYKTKVNLLLTATPKTLTTYSITYNANGGDTSSIPSGQSISNYNDSHTFTIPSTKPTRSGYEFSGWSTTRTGSVAYQPGGSITLQASSPSQTLWAVWEVTAKWSNGVDSGIVYMHEIKSGFCAGNSAIPVNTTIDLQDYRDKTTYRIIKWDDDRCWMYTNLTLHTNDTAGITLNNVYSDIDSETFTLPQSKEAGFSSNDFTAVNAYYTTSSDAGATGYYTWCAATAGSCSTTGTASASICPKNWKLPIGGSSSAAGSFNYLVFTKWQIGNDAAGSNTMRTKKGFAYTGRVKDSAFGHANSDGYWWSRTANGNNSAYALGILETSADPLTYSRGRSYGYAVRCVAQF